MSISQSRSVFRSIPSAASRSSRIWSSPVPDWKLAEAYKKNVVRMYDDYSQTYDSGSWHLEIGTELIHGCGMSKGDSVLDMCAGTGISTLIAAEQVGANGMVVGVDFSQKMLDKAEKKTKEKSNVKFMLGDVESIQFPSDSFDWITCCAAFLWLTDYEKTLSRWHNFLAPGGGIALHAFWENSWVCGAVLVGSARKHGVHLTFHQPTGTPERLTALLQNAGFTDVRIKKYEAGRWISLTNALGAWEGMVKESFPFAPPLFQVSEDLRDKIKLDYEATLKKIETSEGVWEDRTTFMTYARKK